MGDAVIEVDGVSRQADDIVTRVADAVASGWRQLGSPAVDRAVLGLTTAPVDSTSSDRLTMLVARETNSREVWLADDAVTTHYGALAGRPGVSVAVGTGVCCLALPADRPPRVIGGHGYLLGDEGGAYWIGRRALGAVLRAMEGRGPQTSLTEVAERQFDGLDDLHVRIHDRDRPVDAIARFAPDVLNAAAAGERMAVAIVDEAARELLSVIEAGARWVSGQHVEGEHVDAEYVEGGHVDVALGGRLLTGRTELRARLEVLVATQLPNVRLVDADASALEGAVALGQRTDPGRFSDLVRVWRRELAA
jgi:N-acetylglucosamine kinase-like BadF-type ATPase